MIKNNIIKCVVSFITCGCFALMLNVIAFLVAGQILFNNPHIFYVMFLAGIFVNAVWCILFVILANKYMSHKANAKDAEEI